MNTFKNYKKGDLIFDAHELGQCAYIIDSGQVEIFIEEDHSETQIAILEKGGIFGEMAIIDGAERSASARAYSDCRLTEVSPDQLSERIDRSDPIVRLLLSVLLKRVRLGLQHPEEPQKTPIPFAEENPELNLDNPTPLDKIRIESSLSEALDTGSLILYYQPLVNFNTEDIAGFEALIRWRHPKNGMISPALFMGIAEETSLIIPIGRWVVKQACRQFRELKTKLLQQGHSPEYIETLFMSVNVSGRQLEDEEFFDILDQETTAHQHKPENIKLEITERILVDEGKAKSWVNHCRSKGYKVALDDFGTGYSSLQYLTSLSVDNIKLDRSFVKEIQDNSKAEVIVKAIIQMSKGIESSITAEGIETPAEAQVLTRLGCHYGQGYHFCRPQPISEIISLFSELKKSLNKTAA